MMHLTNVHCTKDNIAIYEHANKTQTRITRKYLKNNTSTQSPIFNYLLLDEVC